MRNSMRPVGQRDCPAHYFDINGKVLVRSFYPQGTRCLDVHGVDILKLTA